EIPTYDELGKVVKYAHNHGVVVYLTINIPYMVKMMHDAVKNHIRRCLDQGVDGLIIGNMGILAIVKSMNTHAKLVASMYNASFNYENIEFLRKLGYSRATLEAHLTIPEITEIAKRSKIEIEIFVHGAGCSSIQSRCMFFHFKLPAVTNLSLPHVACVFPYDVYDANTKELKARNVPLLDAQTMCSICQLPELIKTGATGFKITGREDGILYQESATKIYRELIDLIGKGQMDKFEERVEFLKNNFHPHVVGQANLQECYCEQKRCYYPPLFFAQYKQPQSWYGWTKSQLQLARFE
ncbi:MAG: family peptidase, partial [Thermoproteota archaeon]|nr:family peptidase [Thermoproteota archaeon]